LYSITDEPSDFGLASKKKVDAILTLAHNNEKKLFNMADKIKVGLQQLMAGARCFSVPAITRNELMSLTEECSKVTGIPYLMEAYRKEAVKILTS